MLPNRTSMMELLLRKLSLIIDAHLGSKYAPAF